MTRIKILDLPDDRVVTTEELQRVYGGIQQMVPKLGQPGEMQQAFQMAVQMLKMKHDMGRPVGFEDANFPNLK